MAATVEELYRNYGILADAKEDLSKVYKCPPSVLCVDTNNTLDMFSWGDIYINVNAVYRSRPRLNVSVLAC